MDMLDQGTFEEWLDLELEGQLDAAERARLERYLEAHPEAREERASLLRLHGVLAESRVPVAAGFRESVMGALPVAGWEGRSQKAWLLPVALTAVLVLASVLLLGLGATEMSPRQPLMGAILGVGQLAASALVAGSGLLGASWTGLGLVVEEVLARSVGSWIALGVLVLCLNLGLITALRRRWALSAEAVRERNDPTR